MKNQVFNSWEIINEMTIIKKADWSFFKYNGSGIPKATRNYWNINNLSSGEKLHIILNYKGVEYESYIVIDKTRFQRSQIFWNSDLGNIFKQLYPNYNNKNDLDYPSLQLQDLVPVCPNCHCMIHRDKKYILTIEELKQILKINGK